MEVRVKEKGKVKEQEQFKKELKEKETKELNSLKNSIEEYNLTDRELSVLRLLGRSFSNKEIADYLFISFNTAKLYVSRVLNKLNVKTRCQAAIVAIRLHVDVEWKDGGEIVEKGKWKWKRERRRKIR